MKTTKNALQWPHGLIILIAVLILAPAAWAQKSSGSLAQSAPHRTQAKGDTMKVRLIVGKKTAVATLYEQCHRQRLWFDASSLTMNDYDTIERMSDLPRKLVTEGAPDGMTPVAGELTHYAPWGNLAIFIKPRTWSRNLLPLGKIDQGLDILSQPGPYNLRIERIEP
ncbi:cyclophilin-like fold protein (plasmid) [Pseudomonas silvicola]|nr:cyclophilin-like fold protein [Pseudomonas silvicola]